MPETPPKSVQSAFAEIAADGRMHAPTAARNVGPITEVMRAQMPQGARRALEIASGTGQHVVAFARAFPHVTWQPTELDPARLASVEAWRLAEGGANILPPVPLDATGDWPQEGLDFVNVGNLFHLIPAADVETILARVAGALAPGGRFFIYGPFRTDGAFRSDGDAAFHARLRGEDPAIGYKDMDWLIEAAAAAGLARHALVEMPANNLVVVFEKPRG